MKLYFGKSTLTTLLLAGFVAYAALAFWRRAEIQHWGRRTLLVLAWGLVLCVQAAVRDGYHLSVQHAIDGSCAPGLFAAAGPQAIVGGALAAAAVLCAIVTPFVGSQSGRRGLFFAATGCMLVKIAFVELSRVWFWLSGSTGWKF
ncbi:hypothetical protein [Bittarella massiliensis (ex Durand et al. 2017)]|uniref:Uncharacterized protein n=1 Tax=Bittarella massiliensis (ex Durand et al. 2017) TaxID=1720313 RepID=A0AAW5K5A6_9FIRM|nr:hypothetical protein [Bittarella massiliensis (ex Durand et al. 2017)]MBC2871973.1 hypothetical protein [Bittarella massiliensis (ex Durand et al. 2017)]MCQ4948176.1 hypothetical protein [Bittarella massiliensis (ex Durand et al. 2017)]